MADVVDGFILNQRDRDLLRDLKNLWPPELRETAKERPTRSQVRGVNILNDDPGQTVPAYGVMAVSGFELDGAFPTVKIVRPGSTFYSQYVINDGIELAYGSRKRIPDQVFIKAAYDTGTPAAGEWWGPKPSQFTLSKGYPGIAQIAGIVDATNKIALVNFCGQITRLYGKTNAQITKGSSGTVNIHNDLSSGSSQISSWTVTAYNGFSTVATSKYVAVDQVNHGWILKSMEC